MSVGGVVGCGVGVVGWWGRMCKGAYLGSRSLEMERMKLRPSSSMRAKGPILALSVSAKGVSRVSSCALDRRLACVVEAEPVESLAVLWGHGSPASLPVERGAGLVLRLPWPPRPWPGP